MSETDSATNDTNAQATADAPNEAAPVLTGTEAVETKTDAVEANTDSKAEAKPEGDKTEPKDAKAEVPETYEFKPPEGVTLDDVLITEFTPLAKELGLTQENAQKAVDFFASKVLPRVEAQRAEAWGQTQADWAKAAQADKEVGGDAFAANVAIANKAIDRFGTPEFITALKETGAGNHPEFVRFCVRVGKAISEDTVSTGAQGGGQRSAADVLFPTMAQ